MQKLASLAAIFVLLSLGQLFVSRCTAEASSLKSPEVVATTFYKWYLHSISENKDPLTDDKAGLAVYVSKNLIREIESKLNSADGLDQDYFIKAQDYLDDWENNISAKSEPIKGTTDNVIITLGASKESTHQLRVTLTQENNAWKIRKVQQ